MFHTGLEGVNCPGTPSLIFLMKKRVSWRQKNLITCRTGRKGAVRTTPWSYRITGWSLHWIKRGVSGRICDPNSPRQFFDWREFLDENGQVLLTGDSVQLQEYPASWALSFTCKLPVSWWGQGVWVGLYVRGLYLHHQRQVWEQWNHVHFVCLSSWVTWGSLQLTSTKVGLELQL